MAQRLSRLVGLAALLLVVLRLERVLEPAVDTPDWRVIVPAACLGGVLISWATARLGAGKQAAAHMVGILIVVVRVTAPETLRWAILPTLETFPVLAERLAYALDILRFGSPPVLAVSGLAALAAAALWALGAVWGWSVAVGRTWAGIAPPLAFYLYLSVVDRAPSTIAWNLAFVVVAGLGIVATSNLVPAGAGHLRSPDHTAQRRWQARPAATASFTAAALALVGTSILGGVVPAGGAIDWRTSGGEGTEGSEGGFTASRFVGMRQNLLSLSDEIVFAASVDSPPSGTAGYWRLLTLDEYTGEEWVAGEDEFGEVAPGAIPQPVGDTEVVTQDIRIYGLRDDRLPTLYAPQRLASEESVIRSGASLSTDGTLRISARTFDDMTYRVESLVPSLDLDRLASRNGELTPLFAEAAEAGELDIDPRASEPALRPAGIDAYLSLGGVADPAMRTLAEEVTAGAGSPFETALLLEGFFREFTYSADVTTGHSSLDLAAWLTDPDSPNYRTGYCEQFAAAMAVMGRMVGLPTRVVVGFTSGEVLEQEGGRVQVIRERNAHAWVEVWVDGQGWVGFDPTPRTDGTVTPMSRTLGLDPESLEVRAQISSQGQVPSVPDGADGPRDVPIGIGDAAVDQESDISWLPWIVALLVGAGLFAVPWIKAVRRGRRRRQAATGDVEAVWAEITGRLADLGTGPTSSQTPVEYARATARELVPLALDYSACVYGNRKPADATRHLEAAERWIDESFERRQKARAAFSTRSLR